MKVTKRFRAEGVRRAAIATAVCFVALASTTRANAQESPYCAKVRARAAADAALLIAPSLRAEGIKLPSALQKGGTIDPASGSGSGYQIRAGLTVSPLDMYKGFKVVDLADADCQQHQAVVTAQELLQQAVVYGRLPALRKQREFLDASRPRWETVASKTDARLEAKVTTLIEADDVHVRAISLERSREQIVGEIARFEASGIDAKRAMLSELVKNLESSSAKLEDKASHIRSLDTWEVRLTGGYVPAAFGQSSDFFGVVQVSYNVGGFWRNAAESRYVAARSEEVKTARYETVNQLLTFREQMKATASQATREVAIVDRRIAVLTSGRAALSATDAPGAAHALALIELETITAESDRVFLKALIEALSHLEEKS